MKSGSGSSGLLLMSLLNTVLQSSVAGSINIRKSDVSGTPTIPKQLLTRGDDVTYLFTQLCFYKKENVLYKRDLLESEHEGQLGRGKEITLG